jgi:hypothetical protein
MKRSGSLPELAAAILDAMTGHFGHQTDGVPLVTIAVLAGRSYAELCAGQNAQ